MRAWAADPAMPATILFRSPADTGQWVRSFAATPASTDGGTSLAKPVAAWPATGPVQPGLDRPRC